jgi:hypothetical protein
MTMKLDPTQFDVRENTASLRRHASPLVINSSNSESLSMDAVERAQSSLRLSPLAKALDLPVAETQNGATGGKRKAEWINVAIAEHRFHLQAATLSLSRSWSVRMQPDC